VFIRKQAMKFIVATSLFSGILLFCSFFLGEDTPPAPPVGASFDHNPEALGAVHWMRDVDEAKAAAGKTGKPLLILFQEVPGCSNCTRYGNTTLSHPLVVEAMETFFIPVCVYNNKGGKDGAALQRFGEPAWNNPVVRIVRVDDQDIVPRIPNFNTTWPLVQGMCRALEYSGVAVPGYLDLLEEALMAGEEGLDTATFSMYCFWSGESFFGGISGVVETVPGYQDGREVVRVLFNPAVVSQEDLTARAKLQGIAPCSNDKSFRADQEPKYYLAQTDYAFIPMTSLQACRANNLVGKNISPDKLLSPRQVALLKKIAALPAKKWKNMIGRKDLVHAWAEVSE
jgi:hypothetical protein